MKYDIPLLDHDTRFSLWQVKMRAILSQADLDDALDKFGNKASTSWSDEEKRRDRKALSQIHLHLSNNILQEVLQEKTAAALWLKLESICMSKDLTSKMHLKMKLFLHKLQEGGSVPNHLTVFKEIVSDLQAMEVKYEDEDLGLILLCSLPSSFANFRDTILYSRDTLTLNDVCEALQAKEKMKQMVSSDGSASNGEALAARGRTEKKSNNTSRGKSSNGHHGRSKSRGRVKSGGSVRMGDDRPCQIVGIGSVQIKMHDGIVRTLTDVRHIPDMTKNLISLSTLDGKGYKYSGGGGVLNVSKGSLIVMKADLKSANLYRLRGTTITGDAAVISKSLSDSDATNLWHMRLGHMSEHGMEVLSKRGLLDGLSISYKLWNPQTQKVVLSRNVIFNETAMLSDNLSSDAPVERQQKTSVQVEHFIDVDNTPENDTVAVQDAQIPDNSPIVDDSSSVEQSSPVVQPPQHSVAASRAIRARKPVRRLIEECNIAYALSVAEEIEGNTEPSNYSEAITSADCNNWMTAMQDEMESLEKNDLCPQSDDDIEYMSRVPYSSAVGSLMYAMFGKSRDGLVGYVDSDHAGDLDKRRSLTDGIRLKVEFVGY
ncbi:hypothetical protein U9M48_034864 [Paspalum notatum var. saurae]|uniref:GAG-pre-integrase domain-containing protein n=1 Tax=Paspalum notatum var. saurae TaxID=547442 RepID=A0AAQ3X7S0_PASNO